MLVSPKNLYSPAREGGLPLTKEKKKKKLYSIRESNTNADYKYLICCVSQSSIKR